MDGGGRVLLSRVQSVCTRRYSREAAGCVCRAGRVVRSRRARGAVTCFETCQASAVTCSQSPDAARLLPRRADWPPGTFTCFSLPSAVVIERFMLCHVLMPGVSVTPLVSSALAAPRGLISVVCGYASHSFESSVTRCHLPMVRTRDLRLAIMPTGSVVCICRPPMRDVGTCPMIEATYQRNTRPSMRIDESVARPKIACGKNVCVPCCCWLPKAESLSCDDCRQ